MPMSWEMLREMAAHGIETGAHTADHTVLTNQAPFTPPTQGPRARSFVTEAAAATSTSPVTILGLFVPAGRARTLPVTEITHSLRSAAACSKVSFGKSDGSKTVYAHNSANFVKTGDPVKAGTPIGAVGRTGRATTNHVHFEIRSKGVAKNPLPLLQRSQPGPMPAKPHEARAAAHHQPSSEIKG